MHDIEEQTEYNNKADDVTPRSTLGSLPEQAQDTTTTTSTSRPDALKLHERRLTETSQKYDRGNKGYLDETEQALRRLDSQNLGYLDPSKVYVIMQSLQEEQKKSAQLMDTLQHESKKALQLKRALAIMIAMALLLAVANIGVSFAAARLAKDTRIAPYSGDLVSLSTGQTVGTTPKTSAIAIFPYIEVGTNGTSASSGSSGRRRRLRELATNAVCSRASSTATCTVQGQMDYASAVKLYQQFCPQWTPYLSSGIATSVLCTGGVNSVVLQCNGSTSVILGGAYLPAGSPTVTGSSVIFPASGIGYTAQQNVAAANAASFGAASCVQEFSMGMYCDPTATVATEQCLIMAAWETAVCNGLSVQLCS